jgi:RNAse (barnase) inhibitor barstar
MEKTKIIIDFENCINEYDIRNLIKENLNIADWDNKSPDDLLRQLKELKQCKIFFRRTNLVPGNISKYLKQIIDIFDKVEEMYNNIRVYEWEIVTIDFTNVKSVYEIHQLISKKLDFPEWYGGNFPALWDLLTGYIKSYEIHLKGMDSVSKYLQLYLQKIIEIFHQAETEFDYHKIIVE